MSDISNYVDLAVYDRTPEEIVDRALADAAAKLPGWQPREGHAQPLDARVLTPTGWRLMGDLAVGDEVLDPAGAPSRVTGVFPQGLRSVYRVTTDDGGSTLASDDHRWLVSRKHWQTPRPRRVGGQAQVVTTLQLRDLVGGASAPRLPALHPPEFRVVTPLPLDAWLLGFLLGDGGLRTDMVKFTTGDDEIVELVGSALPAGAQIVRYGGIEYGIKGTHHHGRHSYNPVLDALRDLGLSGCKAVEKFIPEAYLFAGSKDRLRLLQGLMDADGHANSHGSASWSTVSPLLARNFVELAWSLGSRAHVQRRSNRTYTSPAQRTPAPAQDSLRIGVRLPEGVNPFAMARKANRYKATPATRRHRTVVEVEYAGEMPCQCISVSAPSQLYITDDFIPTHNTEVVLLEGLALEVAELVYAIDRLPSATMRGLLALYGVTRSDGAVPTATVTFALADDLGHTIPAGTVTRLDLEDDQIRFTTDVDLVVAAGATAGTVAATGDVATDDANGVAAGTVLEMVTSVVFVNSATLATAVTGGADPEGELTWLDRGAKRLARLTDVLVYASHFTARVLEDIRVKRAMTLDNTRGDTGATAGGHVTVAVAAAGGVALSGAVKLELETALEADALANLDVWVVDPTITAVAVTAAVKPLAGFADADVIANVDAALAEYLNADTWEWGGTVRRNELIAVIDRAAGVDYVATLTAPAGDVALAGLAPLASSGVRTITIGA